MLQTTITEFIEKFYTLEGKIANVGIKHMLYGNQKINRCILHPVADGERIGISINGEDIYITMDELRDVKNNDNEYLIVGEVMELHIVL